MRRYLWISFLLLVACTPAVTQPSLPTPTRLPGSLSTPSPEWADLSPYRAAMRPEFAHEVDRFAQATQYRIDLTLSDSLRSIDGRQAVHYVNAETVPLDAVYFRILPNTPTYGGETTLAMLRVNGDAVQPQWELGQSALRVELNPPLRPGAAADFAFDFTTTLPDRSIAPGYDQFGLHRGVLALPNLYFMIPVYDEEGWNVEWASGLGDATYTDTALYQATITAPADQVLAATGVCQATTGGATKTWRCVSGPMRDFMIALSADYRVESTDADGVMINSYFLAQDAEAGRAGLQVAAAALRSYQRRIGPYPFTELDLLETPTTAGGIEYPGLIVVAAELYDHQPTFQEVATAHEVAHQWWYSLVGNDQLDEPWLDEGLTQYTQVLYYRDVQGESAAQTLIERDLRDRYRRVLAVHADWRADLPVTRYSGRQYSSLVYGKAALFFDALYQQLGDEKFNTFLRTYFEARRYGIAHADDLLTAAATQLDRTVIDGLLRQWITTPE
ncbi:MAG TPA: M1 family metallopeptidase [Anaerolineae bacterium]|nr:M1 family metallopeptidase [Anaerolineae bacterium]